MLVPLYTADDVLRELSHGPWDPAFDKTHLDAIGVRVASWVADGVTLDDVRVLAQYNRVFGNVLNARVLSRMDLRSKVVQGRQQLKERDERLTMLEEFRQQQQQG